MPSKPKGVIMRKMVFALAVLMLGTVPTKADTWTYHPPLQPVDIGFGMKWGYALVRVTDGMATVLICTWNNATNACLGDPYEEDSDCHGHSGTWVAGIGKPNHYDFGGFKPNSPLGIIEAKVCPTVRMIPGQQR